MEAAQALFGLLFAHGFVSLNARAVELARPGSKARSAPRSPASTPRHWRSCAASSSASASRLREITKDLPAIYPAISAPKRWRKSRPSTAVAPARKCSESCRKCFRAFASVLPRIQAMTMETQDLFMKLLRERGLLN